MEQVGAWGDTGQRRSSSLGAEGPPGGTTGAGSLRAADHEERSLQGKGTVQSLQGAGREGSNPDGQRACDLLGVITRRKGQSIVPARCVLSLPQYL